MVFKQEKVNLHTHSYYCRHGKGELIDFVNSSRDVFDVLGFSEHCPVPDDSLKSRMPFRDFNNYIADMDLLQRHNNKEQVCVNRVSENNGLSGLSCLFFKNTENVEKNGNMSCERSENRNKDNPVYRKPLYVLKGAECDWDIRYTSFYKDYVIGEKAFDYILGSVHFIKDSTGDYKYIPNAKGFGVKELELYTKLYTDMISSGMFLTACHPDLFFGGYRRWDDNAVSASKDIISCAVENKIPLEINDLGLRKKMIETNLGIRHQYTVSEFWKLAKDMGALICTNTDAHFPNDVRGGKVPGFVNSAFKFASDLDISFVSWDIDLQTGSIRYV